MFKSFYSVILEELVGKSTARFAKNKYELFHIYRNPKSIKKFPPYLRAVSTPNGDLYVADDAFNIIHLDIYKWMYNNINSGLEFPSESDEWVAKQATRGFISWQRIMDGEEFFLGETIKQDFIDKNQKEILKYIKLIEKKNPKLKFYAEKMPNI